MWLEGPIRSGLGWRDNPRRRRRGQPRAPCRCQCRWRPPCSRRAPASISGMPDKTSWSTRVGEVGGGLPHPRHPQRGAPNPLAAAAGPRSWSTRTRKNPPPAVARAVDLEDLALCLGCLPGAPTAVMSRSWFRRAAVSSRATMRLLMVAYPGAGKGTQAEMLADHYGIAHLSSGALLRAEVNNGTRIGRAGSRLLAARRSRTGRARVRNDAYPGSRGGSPRWLRARRLPEDHPPGRGGVLRGARDRGRRAPGRRLSQSRSERAAPAAASPRRPRRAYG